MKKTKVAIAGLGFIGPAHVEALRRIPYIEVVAISDKDELSAQTKAQHLGIEQYTANFDRLLDMDIDSVHICTPNNLHFAMAKKALEAGKHVICEKPLAITIDEARELVMLAEAKKLVNAVHFNIRYYPLVRQMKIMREKGELGEIYSIIGSYLQDWLFYDTDYNWRLEPGQSGQSRAIADIGSHLLDLLEYISGQEIVAVMADLNTVHKTRKKPLKPIDTYSGMLLKPEDFVEVGISTEDHANVLLRFGNGNRGAITVSQVAAGRKNRLSIEIAGSKQSFAWNSEQPNELWLGKRDAPNGLLLRDPSLMHEACRPLVAFPGGHNEGFPDTSRQLFGEVYAAIWSGDQSLPAYPTFRDGLRELILCESIIESNKKQDWVSIT